MKKKLVTVMLAGVLAAGMSAGSVQAATADDASGDLYVFIAASLNNAMEVIQKDFNEEYCPKRKPNQKCEYNIYKYDA